MVNLSSRVSRKYLCWGIYAAGLSLAPITSHAVPETAKSPVTQAQAANTIVLKATPNGCTFLLEKPGADDERLVIVKNGERNVFPTLKEAEADSGPNMESVKDSIATANRDNMKSWFKNGFNSGDEVPQAQYQWRLKAMSLLAVTLYQMNREAILTEDSDSPSLYQQRYMVGHARRVLNTGLSQTERLQSTIRLVYHGFADMKFAEQKRLNRYIKESGESSYLLDYRLKADAFDYAQYYTDQANKGAPKFAVNPEAVGQSIMLDFVDSNIKETLQIYKKSPRIGLNNVADALEAVYRPSVRSPKLNPK